MTQQNTCAACDVVIVNFNAGEMLRDCVLSALSVLNTEASRVIVVDNASLDASVALLEFAVRDKRLLVVRNDFNLGFSAACNIGIKASDAPNILFLNPDSVLPPGALARMIDVLYSAENVGMVGGLLCNPDGTEQPGARRVFPTPKRAFMRAFGLSRFSRFFPNFFSDFLLHKEPLPSAPIVVDAISGACMLVRREAIDTVGLWDEGYFLHCEDLDWCMRFHLKGWEVVFVPDAQVIHDQGGCSHDTPFFVNWHKHRGMLRFYRKFYKKQYPAPLWNLVVLGVWGRFFMLSFWFAVKRIAGKVIRS